MSVTRHGEWVLSPREYNQDELVYVFVRSVSHLLIKSEPLTGNET